MSRSRGGRPRVTLVGVTSAVCALLLVPALAGPAVASRPAPATGRSSVRVAADPSNQVELLISSVSPEALAPAGTLSVSGVAVNRGSDTVDDLSVRLYVSPDLLATRADVAGWAARGPGDWFGNLQGSTPAPASLAPGGRLPFTVSVTASANFLDTFGPYGVTVAAQDGTGQGRGAARTFVVWDPATTVPPAATAVSVLVPLTSTEADTDAATAGATMSAELGPRGRLTELMLAAQRNPELAVAVDPAVAVAALQLSSHAQTGLCTLPGTPTGSTGATATVPATCACVAASTGGSSPAARAVVEPATALSAGSWVNALAGVRQHQSVLALPFADPDIAALAGAGSDAVPLLRQAMAQSQACTQMALGRALELSVQWPAGGAADTDTATLVDRAARGTLAIVSSASMPATDQEQSSTLSAPAVLPGTSDPVLVADDQLGTDLAGISGPNAGTATERTLAELAAVSMESGVSRHLLVTAPRGWTVSAASVSRWMAAVRAAPWIRLEPLSSLIRLRPQVNDHRTRLVLTPAQRSAQPPAAVVAAIVRGYTGAQAFRSALSHPDVVLDPLDVTALSLLGQAWRLPGQSRLLASRAAPAFTASVAALFGDLSVPPAASRNLLASTGTLPVTVENRFDQAITVDLRMRALTGRLLVGPPVRVTLDPKRTKQLAVRVRAVANGDVQIEAMLIAPDGQTLVTSAPVQVRVRAEWEGRGLGTAALVLAALLVAGLVRSVRRGRQVLPPESAPDPDDIGDDRLRRARRSDSALGPRAAVNGHAVVAEDLWPGPITRTQHRRPEPAAVAAGRPSAAARPSRRHAAVAFQDGRQGSRGSVLPAAPTGPRGAGDGDGGTTDAVARSSALMAAGTLASRVLGQVRASALGWAIGGAVSANVFSTANTLPNSFYILLAGGVLNAVLVPQIVRADQRPDGAEFVERLLTVSLVVLLSATILVTAAAAPLYWLFNLSAPPTQLALGTAFALWCLPQMFFYGLYTLLGQVLNARGSFGPYMWTPVLANVVTIAGIAVFVVLEGSGSQPVTWWTPTRIGLLAGTATAGIVVQAVVLLPVLRRTGFRWRPRWGLRGVGLRAASRVAGWTFAAAAVGQLGLVVISNVTNRAGEVVLVSGQHAAGRWVYDQAYLLFILPHSLVTVSLVTSVFTRMSAAAAAARLDAVRADLSLAVRTTGVATVVATAAVIVLGRDVTAVLFAGNNRGTTDGLAAVTIAMILGLVPFSVQYLLQRVFYAFEDARTPFRVTALTVGVWAAGSLIALIALPAGSVTVGVGLAMTVGNVVGAVVAARLLRRRIGSLDGLRIVQTYVRLILAALVAGALAWVVDAGTHELLGPGRLASLASLALAGSSMIALYGLALRALRVREVSDLMAPLLNRAGLRTGR